MAQTAFTVRMDSDVKNQFDELCKDFGMSSNTAFNIFARTVIKRQRIPFDLESEREATIRRGWEAAERIRQQAADNGSSEMTMDQINEMIKEYRDEQRQKKNNQ